MVRTRTVNIRELKDRLSADLRELQRSDVFLVVSCLPNKRQAYSKTGVRMERKAIDAALAWTRGDRWPVVSARRSPR